MTAGNLACRSSCVERTRKRTVAECLGSVAALTRIPLINDHLDWHPASPHAASALFLVCSCGKSPMTAFPVDRERRWNTAPRGRRGLFLSRTYPDFQITDLIEFNRLKPRVGNWQRITGHRVPGAEMVFGVSPLPGAQAKFSSLGSAVVPISTRRAMGFSQLDCCLSDSRRMPFRSVFVM